MKKIFKSSLKNIFIFTSLSTLIAIFVTLGVVFYEVSQVVQLDKQSKLSAEAENTILKTQYHIIQVQQFFTDASLTGNKDSIKEATENYESFEKTLNLLNELKPEFAVQIKLVHTASKNLFTVGQEMFKAYTTQGKEAGDTVMTREETGLDARSATLDRQVGELLVKIHNDFEIRGKAFQNALFKLKLWPSLLAIFVALSALATLFFMLRKINTLKEVNDVLTEKSTQIAATLADVFSISNELSNASSRQSEAVEETVASIEEISAMAGRSAENATVSSKDSQHSKVIAERGQQIIHEMVDAVDQINKCNSKIEQTVTESSLKFKEIIIVINEIGLKTKVINDIVFQTKLLSFNASVEAARAGEHGKGFAVVAEEMGNLAQMSGKAADEISQLLLESTKRVGDIVDSSLTSVDRGMAEVRTAVNRGTQVAADCSTVLTEIVEISTRVSKNVLNISEASQEQSLGVAEVTKALRQIDHSTLVTLESSKGSLQSAEVLAERLKEIQTASSNLSEVISGARFQHHFAWTENYRLKVAAMDDEHMVLIDKMNYLFDQIGKNDRAGIKRAYDDLAAYAIMHFEHEEKYFDSIDYPHSQSHKAIHRNLINKVQELGTRLGQKDFDTDEIGGFLRDWLMRHILQVDKGYASENLARNHDSTRRKRAA